MTRSDFLGKLKDALSNDLNSQTVRENVKYYDSYISDEIRKGRNERDVLSELGDPWVIAQTIIDMSDEQSGYQDSGVSGYRTGTYQSEAQSDHYTGNAMHFSTNMSKWKLLLFVLGMIGILVLVMGVIGSILAVAMRFLLPVLAIVCVYRLIKKKKR